MSKPETVYDSTTLQIENLDNLSVNSLSLKELSKPEVVVMILERQKVTLTELKSSKDEAIDLKIVIDNLRDERTVLKVDLALAEQRQSVLMLEIPISILTGFAINILTAKPTDGLGWVLLILSLLMLLFLRFPQVYKSLKTTKKEEINGSQEN